MNELERPDFYILNEKDWSNLMRIKEKEFKEKHPNQRIKVINNVMFFLDQINKQGKPYSGCGIKPKDIEPFKEKWDKIINAFN